MTRVIALGLTVLVLCSLAACGKKGDPSAPGPPDQIIYPKAYPTK